MRKGRKEGAREVRGREERKEGEGKKKVGGRERKEEGESEGRKEERERREEGGREGRGREEGKSEGGREGSKERRKERRVGEEAHLFKVQVAHLQLAPRSRRVHLCTHCPIRLYGVVLS
jgi:hypothetical protein